jgi:hypothetical protein
MKKALAGSLTLMSLLLTSSLTQAQQLAQVPPLAPDQSPQAMRAAIDPQAVRIRGGAFGVKDSRGCYWNVMENSPGDLSLGPIRDQQGRPLCDQ